MVRTQKDDANRGIDGEQREIEFECDHVEDRERRPVRKANLRSWVDDVIARIP